jgi:thiamine biosynthesis lipoprotein
METFQFRAMNSGIVFLAEGDPLRIADGFNEAWQFIQASESRFSRFLHDSELSELNRSAGRPFRISPELFSVIALSQQFFHQTNGLFDPSVLADLRRIGYDISMDLLRYHQISPVAEPALAGKKLSFSLVELDEARSTVLLPAGMELDLGGIAKGWIAEQAALILLGFCSACAVNAGGDMYLAGFPAGEEKWLVDLEHPLQPELTLATFKVGPGAVATSTVTKRVWKQGDELRHHLIDPRTGEPVVTDWLSVTVIAPHAYQAEVYAKSLLIAGPHEFEEILGKCGSQLTYLAVDRYGNILGTQVNLEAMHVN